jgi:hypothetical protein
MDRPMNVWVETIRIAADFDQLHDPGQIEIAG